jgi:insulysin
METPHSDKRVYEHITLSNGLSCLIVSDNETEKAAASVAVAVGQMQGEFSQLNPS